MSSSTGQATQGVERAKWRLPKGLETTLAVIAYPGIYGAAAIAPAEHKWLVALSFFFALAPAIWPFTDYEASGSRLQTWLFEAAEMVLAFLCFVAWIFPLLHPMRLTVGRAAGWALLTVICILPLSLLATRRFGRKQKEGTAAGVMPLGAALVAGPLLGVILAGMVAGDVLFGLYVFNFFGVELPLFFPPLWLFVCGAVGGLAFCLRLYWKSRKRKADKSAARPAQRSGR